MVRKVFHSFHYDGDSQRASMVRNIGAIEGNTPVSSNKWEQVKLGGDRAVQRWIESQLRGRHCTIVLIGAETAERPWVHYEIVRSWERGMGLLGIYIHNLKDLQGNTTHKGANPFREYTIAEGPRLSSVVTAYSPPVYTSKSVYRYIAENIEDWVEDAVETRECYE